jgi:hypothetical protein
MILISWTEAKKIIYNYITFHIGNLYGVHDLREHMSHSCSKTYGEHRAFLWSVAEALLTLQRKKQETIQKSRQQELNCVSCLYHEKANDLFSYVKLA